MSARLDDLFAATQARFDEWHYVAHGFDHVERVSRLARYIAEQEGYDPEVAAVAGLLHDVGRTIEGTDHKTHGPAGVPLAAELLETYTDYPEPVRQAILDAVRDHSLFKAEGDLSQIVQDADRLDGLGAVGLMRAYTSHYDHVCYDPADIAPAEGKRGGTIHDMIAFQMEWLDMMNTPTGRRLGTNRHAFMRTFLDQFQSEVEGGDLD